MAMMLNEASNCACDCILLFCCLKALTSLLVGLSERREAQLLLAYEACLEALASRAEPEAPVDVGRTGRVRKQVCRRFMTDDKQISLKTVLLWLFAQATRSCIKWDKVALVFEHQDAPGSSKCCDASCRWSPIKLSLRRRHGNWLRSTACVWSAKHSNRPSLSGRWVPSQRLPRCGSVLVPSQLAGLVSPACYTRALHV